MLSFGWIRMFGKTKTRRSIAFTVPPLLFIILSLLMWSYPQLCLPAYSFWSPLQPPWFLHYFLQLLPMGLTRLVRSYIPIPAHVFPHPQWLENPCLRPLQHLLAFLVILLLSISFFHFFSLFFVSSVYFCLLTLSSYPLSKWYIRALFLWANLQHSHLKCCHEVRLPCYCSFFSIAYANCLDPGQKVS